MADIALDITPGSPTFGDWLFTNGDVQLTSDAQAGGTNPVLQHVLQRLRLHYGEWFLDTSAGVPWLQELLQKGSTATDRQNSLRTAILNTPGIVQLTRFTETPYPAQRRLVVSFTASSIAGPIDYTGSIEFGPVGSPDQ